jgi:predicted RNA-binding Zn-ribbon protein involved in translation (DUF1610 family)
MSHSTYFVQGCPTCGRRLHVRVEYLGKRVVCQHCGGSLVASDGAGRGWAAGSGASSSDCPAAGEALLRRADELLKRTAEHARHSRPK